MKRLFRGGTVVDGVRAYRADVLCDGRSADGNTQEQPGAGH